MRYHPCTSPAIGETTSFVGKKLGGAKIGPPKLGRNRRSGDGAVQAPGRFVEIIPRRCIAASR
ncbi:MAG TPA: hypothetical protein PK823_04035 [Novosphingobium sp.]|nr:hypothetical protein [Novosphingobium sp.]